MKNIVNSMESCLTEEKNLRIEQVYEHDTTDAFVRFYEAKSLCAVINWRFVPSSGRIVCFSSPINLTYKRWRKQHFYLLKGHLERQKENDALTR